MNRTFIKSIFSLIAGTSLLISPLSAQTEAKNPNGAKSQPEPGWSLWRPPSERKKANFTAGFSNIELGGYLDFEDACKTAAGIPEDQIQYWFRTDSSLNRTGVGTVETGCWVNGRFLHTTSTTAIKNSLKTDQCLRVKSPQSLVIRSQPSKKSKRRGTVARRAKVRVDGYPTWATEREGENWIKIKSPKNGWISDGKINGKGNLELCK